MNYEATKEKEGKFGWWKRAKIEEERQSLSVEACFHFKTGFITEDCACMTSIACQKRSCTLYREEEEI